MERLKSGIEGFDQLVFGGLPSGRAYLVSGEPGTGKTLFSMQFLLEGLHNGEHCVFITIDEKPEHIIDDCTAIGWDLSTYLENGQLKIIDVTSFFSAAQFKDGGLDGDGIIKQILSYVQNSEAKRLAIDPIAPLIFKEENFQNIVDYIRNLVFRLEEAGTCTSLLTSYVPVGSEKVSQHGVEEFAASGIILLRLSKANTKYIRSIRVRKARGTRIDLTEYSFEILPQRGLVLRQPI